ncbi:hypothetical protein N9Y89_00190 [bacterium]|nr:hypothetical protein [bacterium]
MELRNENASNNIISMNIPLPYFFHPRYLLVDKRKKMAKTPTIPKGTRDFSPSRENDSEYIKETIGIIYFGKETYFALLFCLVIMQVGVIKS